MTKFRVCHIIKVIVINVMIACVSTSSDTSAEMISQKIQTSSLFLRRSEYAMLMLFQFVYPGRCAPLVKRTFQRVPEGQ